MPAWLRAYLNWVEWCKDFNEIYCDVTKYELIFLVWKNNIKSSTLYLFKYFSSVTYFEEILLSLNESFHRAGKMRQIWSGKQSNLNFKPKMFLFQNFQNRVCEIAKLNKFCILHLLHFTLLFKRWQQRFCSLI